MFTRNSCLFIFFILTFVFLLPSSTSSDFVGPQVAQAAQATALPAPQFTAVDFTATSTVATPTPTSISSSSSTSSAVPSTGSTGSPQAGSGQAAARTQPVAQQEDSRDHLVIPSIGIDAPIDPVGINSLGQMAVPSGSTDDVGWYEFGTVPGQVGSAVIDAHVFAGFSELHNIQVGESIYVDSPDGKELRFVVQDIEDYPLADVPTDTLFAQTDAARLNLITCAGDLTPDHSTYDHRLVVYAVLAQ